MENGSYIHPSEFSEYFLSKKRRQYYIFEYGN